ncbi:P-loop containing nucleoside triphosphate hydrolase protein, partial [Athelia psychrophila]
KIVLILVGRIASGKSTFAKALEEHLPNRFRRCNQDDLGDRRKVETLARATLREGMSPCVDRVNFDPSQRAHWINIAREFAGTPVWVIVFDTPSEVCAARLRERTSHPTIKTPEDGLDILARFESIFKWPSSQEGYDRLISISPAQHIAPMWTCDEINSILQKLEDS